MTLPTTAAAPSGTSARSCSESDRGALRMLCLWAWLVYCLMAGFQLHQRDAASAVAFFLGAQAFAWIRIKIPNK